MKSAAHSGGAAAAHAAEQANDADIQGLKRFVMASPRFKGRDHFYVAFAQSLAAVGTQLTKSSALPEVPMVEFGVLVTAGGRNLGSFMASFSMVPLAEAMVPANLDMIDVKCISFMFRRPDRESGYVFTGRLRFFLDRGDALFIALGHKG